MDNNPVLYAPFSSAIEKDFTEIVDYLFDFGFRFCAVSRPSPSLTNNPQVILEDKLASSPSPPRKNPIDLFTGSLEGANWLTMALRPKIDTALLAVIRCNRGRELFNRIIKVGPSRVV